MYMSSSPTDKISEAVNIFWYSYYTYISFTKIAKGNTCILTLRMKLHMYFQRGDLDLLIFEWSQDIFWQVIINITS